MRRTITVLPFLMAVLLALASPATAQNTLTCLALSTSRTFPAPAKVRFTWGMTCDLADTAALNLLNRALTAKGDTLTAAKAVIVKLQDSLAKLATVPPTPPPVPTPTLTAVAIGPKVATLAPGGTQFFLLAPTWSDGATRAITPSCTATGGSLSGCFYTAGAVAGTFRVIGTANGKADTATVTITGTVTPPPPPPSPLPAPGPNALYFNSGESGCGDANSLLCDDFEDGTWYEKNCDAANASGGLLQTDGWCGTIYGAPSAPALCGNFGYRSNCAAQSSQAMYGDHSLAQPASDLYVRFYTKMLPGYTPGAEKMLTFNAGPAGVGGIWAGDLHMNCGGSGAPAALQWQNSPNEPSCRNITTLNVGTWYFIEIHMNTAAKVLQFWVDDCGPFGAGCTGTPTLRLDLTGYSILKSGTVGSLWFENWSNPSSSGIRLVDQIKVSRVGPIGFMP